MSQFAEVLGQMTRDALAAGVSPGEIVLCLELTKHELANQMLAQAQAEPATVIHVPRKGS